MAQNSIDPPKNIFNIIGFLQRPWIVETICFFLVAWQESVRLSLRTAHKDISPNRLRDFYFYNFGDFVNGYIMAFIFDGLVNYFIFQKIRTGSEYYKIFNFTVTKVTNAILATFVSILIIAAFEIRQSSAYTTADLMDIPAGAGGALAYCVVRLVMLRLIKGNSPQKQ
jgi:hypothetical protein